MQWEYTVYSGKTTPGIRPPKNEDHLLNNQKLYIRARACIFFQRQDHLRINQLWSQVVLILEFHCIKSLYLDNCKVTLTTSSPYTGSGSLTGSPHRHYTVPQIEQLTAGFTL